MRSRFALAAVPVRTAFTCAAALTALLMNGCSDDTDDGAVGPAAHLTITAGDATFAVVGSAVGPFAVKVTDSAGVAVRGVAVTFVASDGLTISTTSATTDVAGTAFTAGTFSHAAGLRTITATAAGIADPVQFHLTANADGASVISAAGGSDQAANAGTLLSEPLSASVTDQFGNPVPGVSVTWAAPSGIIGTPSGHTAANGLATTAFTLPAQPGTVMVTATALIDGQNQTATFSVTGH